MRPLREVIEHTLDHVQRLPVAPVDIDDASGLYLSEPVLVHQPVPPFDNTAVDGFAVCLESFAATTSPVLKVTATIAAGDDPRDQPVAPGEAIRIMTGAPIPPGTEAIVMVEDTSIDKETVTIHVAPSIGANIRRQGSDIDAGQYVFDTGTKITPAVRGVLASLGTRQVNAFRRPIIGVISTGDELSDAPELPPGKIRDSNRPSLLDSIRSAGAVALDLGNIRDDPVQLRTAFTNAVATCDALVTSGGVSVGDFDYTKAVLDELSDNQFTWFQVAIKPAKPYAFGLIDGVPVFGLPGNPVSALVSFELFVRPSILKMLGASTIFRPTLRARTTVDLHHQRDGKLHLLRGSIETDSAGDLTVTPQGHQGSHVLTGMAQANGLILIPDGAHHQPGETVEVLLIGDLGADSLSIPASIAEQG
jgi:molybdopterin molybdotransferase